MEGMEDERMKKGWKMKEWKDGVNKEWKNR